MGFLNDLFQLKSKWNTCKDRRLADEEKKILVLAEKNSGIIYRLSTEETGEYIQIGDEELYSNDPANRDRYIEALKKLLQRGLVRRAEGVRYELTGTGFDKARELRAD